MEATVERAARLIEMGRAAQARDMLARVLASDPDNVDGLVFLAHACHKLGDTEGQADAAGQVIQVAPEVADGHRYYALAMATLGKRDEAVRHARQAVQLAPHSSSAHLALAWALVTDPPVWRRGRILKEAYQVAEQAAELSEGSWESHYVLAVVSLHQGEPGRAERSLQAALASNPDCAPALNLLGNLSLHQDRTVEAARLLVAALVADPADQTARDGLANVIKRLALNAAMAVMFGGLVVLLALHAGRTTPFPVRLGTAALLAPLIPAWLGWTIRRMGPWAYEETISMIRQRRSVAVVAGLSAASWLLMLAAFVLSPPAAGFIGGFAVGGCFVAGFVAGATHNRRKTAN